MEIKDFFSRAENLTRILFPLVFGIMSAIMINFISKELLLFRTKTSAQEKYFSHLESGLKTNQFNDEFCKIAFNTIDRDEKGTLMKYGYVESLEDFLVRIVSKSGTDNTYKIYSNIILNVLREAKKIEPYASLPPEERRLMASMQQFIQNGDKPNSLNTLNQLKQVVLARHKEYENIARLNSWSLPLAIASIVLTILFGIGKGFIAIIRRTKPI